MYWCSAVGDSGSRETGGSSNGGRLPVHPYHHVGRNVAHADGDHDSENAPPGPSRASLALFPPSPARTRGQRRL